MQNFQFTLGSGATQATSSAIQCRQVTIQNNSAANCRVGGSGVSSTSGILLLPGGSVTFGPMAVPSIALNTYYAYGTSSDVIDVAYEP